MISDSWFWTILIYGLGIGAVIGFLVYRAPLAKFFGEVKVELAKCTWPWDPEQTGLRRYKSLIDSTVMVMVLTILLSGYVAGFDILIGRLIRLLVSF